jgi:hypothetical protein
LRVHAAILGEALQFVSKNVLFAVLTRTPQTRSKVDRRGRGHVLDDLAENVEGGCVSSGLLGLGGLDRDGHAVGQVVAEGAAVAIDAGVLHEPAVGDDKAIREVEVGPVLAFAKDILVVRLLHGLPGGPLDDLA